MRNPIRWLALTTALALVAACGGSDGDDQSAPTSTSSTTNASTTLPAPATDVVPVRVYFVRDEAVATAGRSVEAPAVARGALLALLEGPSQAERDQRMSTQIPSGTQLRGVDIRNGTATVDFDPRFESGGGSLSMTLRMAEVVYTLTQFPTVERVNVTIDGRAVDAIGGEGLAARNLTRADYESVTPAVLIESPTPGADITSPLTVSGTSNTFEATVNYVVTDPDGLILADGFTTATSGNGVRGAFSFVATFTSPRPGIGEVIAFQISPETGEQDDVYEVPVDMT